MLADHRDGLSSSSFLAWSSIAQSVCQRAFSLLANWCLGSRVQILLSAEEHNLSPFDLNIAGLCQSIEINNNKHVIGSRLCERSKLARFEKRAAKTPQRGLRYGKILMLCDIINTYEWFFYYNWHELCSSNKLLDFSSIYCFLVKYAI